MVSTTLVGAPASNFFVTTWSMGSTSFLPLALARSRISLAMARTGLETPFLSTTTVSTLEAPTSWPAAFMKV